MPLRRLLRIVERARQKVGEDSAGQEREMCGEGPSLAAEKSRKLEQSKEVAIIVSMKIN